MRAILGIKDLDNTTIMFQRFCTSTTGCTCNITAVMWQMCYQDLTLRLQWCNNDHRMRISIENLAQLPLRYKPLTDKTASKIPSRKETVLQKAVAYTHCIWAGKHKWQPWPSRWRRPPTCCIQVPYYPVSQKVGERVCNLFECLACSVSTSHTKG